MSIPFERRSGQERPKLRIEELDPHSLRPYAGNARAHSAQQIQRLATSISSFGFVVPAVISGEGEIIAGHARVEAAKRLGLDRNPCLRVEHLSRTQQKAYRLTDNRLAELASWDANSLAKELQGLSELNLDFSLEITGFDTAEIEFIIEGSQRKQATDPADAAPALVADQPAVARFGDLWLLGKHRLLCGDARQSGSFERLMGQEKAQLVFTDPPHDFPIDGRASDLGVMRGRDGAPTDEEMALDGYERFLRYICAKLVEFTVDGAIHFLCTDWRHAKALLTAAQPIYSALMNMCVWDQAKGGPSSLYQSMHELVFVWKAGTAPHINNIKVGRSGRERINVWHHAGATSDRPELNGEQVVFPTVKPVALIADAIRDCSKRGGVVLDPFAGSGAILMAAERTGRRAVAIEVDSLRVDAAIRRWQADTGKSAIHADSGATFAERLRATSAAALSTTPSS